MVTVSVVWFFVLGGLGLIFPYYSLYLRENAGLSGTEVGAVLAVLPLVGIFVQGPWGQLADRTGSRARVLVVLCFGSAAGYGALGLGQGFTSLLLLTAALACFSTPLIPTTVAVTFALAKGRGPNAFGLARVWGTLGFLALVLAFPPLLHGVQEMRGLEPVPGGPSEPGLGLIFPLTAAIVALGGLVALAIPRETALELRAQRGDWRQLARHGPYLRLLFFSLLAFGLLQGPMSLFPVYVRAHGGSLDSVSSMWVLMLALEIPLIALSGASLDRLGPRGLLALGVLAGGARWLVCGVAPESLWVMPVQILHGVVVAGLVIGAPLYVEAAVPEHLRSTGQGVLAMLGVSVGGSLSNLGAGWLLEHHGPDAPYLVAGLGAVILALLVPILLPAPHRPTEPPSNHSP